MSNAKVVDGNKVLVELEWEQIDAIVRNEVRDHIYMVHRELQLEGRMHGEYVHPDDIEHNKILLPALLTVYEYWAGEEAANKIKEQLNADETLRSAD